MADINANIGVGIDTSDALNQLKNLQRQISQFHTSVARSSETAAVAQRDLQRNFLNSVNSIGGFSAELRTVRTTTESFTNSLEKNKFSMGEYFRFSAASTKTFGKSFRNEMNVLEKTAVERVKTLQTQYVKLGRDANGAMQSIAIRPTTLDMTNLGTQTAIAAQKQALFNQLLKQGSTNLLNFGKNTQWAGRQLMVGFTLPLATLGMVAGKTFMTMEESVIKFRKVYGDLFTSEEDTAKALEGILDLAKGYTQYGVAISDVLGLAAEAAAAGFQDLDLQNQTAAATKLSVLGQLDMQKALETTISLQNAFGLSSEELAESIDFLNAVENQTVVSLDDITTAIPRVAPVIKSLGGDVKDLAFFLSAMKEGGVNAAQGANALKSGLASLVNPSTRASQMLMDLGININSIVSSNQGDLKSTVVEFAQALDTLDPLSRARAIEQLFGKFQFARISTLFTNITKEGTQASRVLDLASSSVDELAALSDKELGQQAASSMMKFTRAIEDIKLALVPLGEIFLNIATPFLEFGTSVLGAFNNLPDGIKKVIATTVAVVGGLGPVLLMTFGLIANGVANMIKFFAVMRLGFLKITGQSLKIGQETQYMTQEQLEATAAAASLDQAHSSLTQRFTAERVAVDALRDAYSQAVAAGNRFASINPGLMRVGSPQKFAEGGIVRGPGTGTSDSIPALLSNGEAVIPAAAVKQYAPIIQGMIAGNLPGYAKGVMLGMPGSSKNTEKNRTAAQQVHEAFLQSSFKDVPPTEYGHQLSPSSGRSFPIWGVGGVYMGPGGQKVFVKPVVDEKAAIAEMRGTQIARQAHGLKSPEQRITVMRDPSDPTRTRRFLALESKLDSTFVSNDPMALFNEEQYFKQLVASLLRVDKDLSAGNVFGGVVADVGPAGVFNRASGVRDYQEILPSMEEQAMVNLLGIKGGAKRAFAESTLGLMNNMTPEQYRQNMVREIQQVLPLLKQTVADFNLSSPQEVEVYQNMIRRLESGLGVDWSKFHAIHAAVKPAKPKQSANPVPGYANGVVSVPGPKGAGDVVAAMLSPGEAVIPAKMAKKYAPLVQGMIAGNIPGFELGTLGAAGGTKGYTNAVHLLSPQVNAGLNTGTQNPQSLSSELSGSGGKVLAPIIHEIAKSLGAKSKEDIAKLLSNRPELIALAQDTAGAMADELANMVEVIGDKEYSEIFERNLKEKVASLDKDIQDAATKVLTEITTIENDTKLRIRRGGKVDPQGRLGISSDTQSYRSQKDRYMETASLIPGGPLPEKTVLAHATMRTVAPIDEMLGDREISSSARDMKDNLEKGITKIYEQGSAGLVVDVPTEAIRSLEGNVSRGIIELFNEGSKAVKGSVETSLNAKDMSAAGAKIAKEVASGVSSAVPEAKVAGKKLAAAVTQKTTQSGASFGNTATQAPLATNAKYIGATSAVPSPAQATQVAQDAGAMSMSPLRAYFTVVGANLREVFAEFKTELGIASSDTMGPIKAYATMVTANLRDSFQDSKQELAGIFGQTSGVLNGVADGISVANKKVIVGGREYTRNFIADAQGRDGAIEAVLTKNTAALVSKLNTQYSTGLSRIPPIVSKELTNIQKEFIAKGKALRIASVNQEIERGKALLAAQRQAIPPATGPTPGQSGFVGPLPEGMASPDVAVTKSFSDVTAKVSQFSFALSALTGITSMFGTQFSGLTTAISLISGGLFALIQVSSLLTSTKLKEIAATRAATVAQSMGALTGPGGIAGAVQSKQVGTMIRSLFTGLTGFKGIISGVGIAIKALLGFISVPMLAFAALAGAVFLTVKVIENQREKIEGLGNAAFATGKKLENIASIIGFEPTRTADRSGQITAIEGLGAGGAQAVQEIRTSEEFTELKDKSSKDGGFKQDIEAIKNATLEQAESALNNLALQLLAVAPEGTDPARIQEYVAAIAAEAGKTDVDLSFILDVDLSDPKTFDTLVVSANEALSEIQNSYKASTLDMNNVSFLPKDAAADLKVLGSTYSSTFEALNTGFASGTISAEAYRQKTNTLLTDLASLGSSASVALDKMFENTSVDPKDIQGIQDINERLLIFQALQAGGNVDPAWIEALDAADDYNATQDEITKGAEARTAIEGELADAIKATTDQQTEDIDTARTENIKTSTEAIGKQIETIEKNMELYPELVKALGSEEAALAALNDEMVRGLLIDAEAKDLQDGGTTNRDNVIADLLALTETEEAYNNVIADSGLKTQIEDLQEQNSVLDWLRSNGMSTADALKVIGNSTLYAAAAARLGTEDFGDFKVMMEEFNSLSANLRGGGGGGGARKKTPLEETMEGLRQQRKEILNTSSAYSKLRAAGVSVGDALRAASDSGTALAVASTKVKTSAWDKLVKLIKQTDKELKKSQILELLRTQQSEIVLSKAFAKVIPILSSLGLEADQIQEILSNPALAEAFVRDLKDGKVNAKDLRGYLAQIAAMKQIEINISMSTDEGVEDAFAELADKAMFMFDVQRRQIEDNYEDQISALEKSIEASQDLIDGIQTDIDNKQRDIELDITRPINALQEELSDIQRQMELNLDRPIADLQTESADLSNDLTLIDNAAKGINEKYDDQAKALAKVSAINQQIANQQKGQLSLADAISQGDISAAANAMQDIRSANAEASASSMEQMLEASRKGELDNLRSADGRTRDQIEKRQFEIGQRTFDLEKQRRVEQEKIEAIQDKIYNLEEKREVALAAILVLEDSIYNTNKNTIKPLEDQLGVLEDQKQVELDAINANEEAWTDALLAADQAKIAAEGYEDVLTMSKFLIDGIKSTWDNIKTKTIELFVKTVNLPADVTLGSTGTVVNGSTNNGGGGGGGNDEKPTMPTTDPGIGGKWVYDTKSKTWKIEIVKKPTRGPGRGRQWSWDRPSSSWKSIIWKSIPLAPLAEIWNRPSGTNLASGGFVSGPGTPTSDSIPAMLSDGEYVVKASSVNKLGVDFLDSMNKSGDLPGYRLGGFVIPDRPSKSKPAVKKPAMTMAAKQQSAIIADKRRTAPTNQQKYKAGGFQGFEAGFQGTMEDIGKNPIIQKIGKAYASDTIGGKIFRGIVGALSVPVETMGAIARNSINALATSSNMFKAGNPLGAIGAGFAGINPLKAIEDGAKNAFSGVRDASKQKDSMFEQTAQSVIKNRMFGTADPEKASLARIIGGVLNVAGDPLTYAGVGLVTRGVKAAVQPAMTTGRAAAIAAKKAASRTVSKVDGVLAKSILNRALTNPRMAIAMSPIGVEDTIRSKQLKNIFQVEEAGGEVTRRTGYTSERLNVENSLLGIPKDAPSSARPTYGAITSRSRLPYTMAKNLPGLTGRVTRMLDPRLNKQITNYAYSLGSNFSKKTSPAVATTKPGVKGSFTISDSFITKDRPFKIGNKADKAEAIEKIMNIFRSERSSILDATQNTLPYLEAQMSGAKNPFDFINKLEVPITGSRGGGFGVGPETAAARKINLKDFLTQQGAGNIRTGTIRNLDPDFLWEMKKAKTALLRSPPVRTAKDFRYKISEQLKERKRQQLLGEKEMDTESGIRPAIDWNEPVTKGVKAGAVAGSFARKGPAFSNSSRPAVKNGTTRTELEIPGTRSSQSDWDTGRAVEFADFMPAIQSNGKMPTVFQGFLQGTGRAKLSELESTANVILPTPTNILNAGKTTYPSLRNLRINSMIRNFENKTIGKKETHFLKQAAASVYVDDLGKARSSADILGLQDLISSVSGNFTSKKLLKNKASSMESIIEQNRLSKISERKEFSDKYPNDSLAANPKEVSMIHSTAYPIVRNSNGNVELRASGEYTVPGVDESEAARSSIHFTAEAAVKDHLFGSWDPYQSKIVSSLASMVDNNGVPYALNPVDTFWTRNPGQPLVIPDASVITPYKDLDSYISELIKRGLMKPGEAPPRVAADPLTRDVLYHLPDDMVKLKGQDFEALQQEALDAAKNQIGTKVSSTRLEDHGTTDGMFDSSMRKLAEEYKASTYKHYETFPAQAEGTGTLGFKGSIPGISVDADSMEAMLMIALQGRYPMGEMYKEVQSRLAEQVIIRKGLDFASSPSEAIPKLAKGGLVKPQYLRAGGLAKGTDTVPAMLTPGEFVMNKSSSEKFLPELQSMNRGLAPSSFKMPSFDTATSGPREVLSPSSTTMIESSSSQVDNSVYTYNLNVNVSGSSSTPDEIAGVVMNKIRNLQSQQVRRQVIR